MAERQLTCPVCRRPTRYGDEPRGPFCSERCRLVDLGAWADGSYRMPAQSDWMDDDVFSESPTGSADGDAESGR